MTTNTDKWSDLRENLRKHAEKFPATLIDVIDSAYLVGLEAKNPDLKSIHEKVEAAAFERGREQMYEEIYSRDVQEELREEGRQEGMKLLRGDVIKLAKAEGAAAEREAIVKALQRKHFWSKGTAEGTKADIIAYVAARTTTPPGEGMKS